jgi:hypothetical protein
MGYNPSREMFRNISYQSKLKWWNVGDYVERQCCSSECEHLAIQKHSQNLYATPLVALGTLTAYKLILC